jgi:uncharacterized protein
MSDLKSRVLEDIKTAMKAGDKDRDSVQITDAVVITTLEKMLKQRRDSESQFRSGNRPDLADKETAEIAVLMHYLPQQLSEAEVLALIQQAITETGAQGAKDMGKLMAWLKPKVAGKTDMGKLSGLIKAQLG